MTRLFEEYTLVWLLLSSIVGGFIGATFKYLFELVLPERLKDKAALLAIQKRYATPILLAVIELEKRLHNIIRLIDLIETESGWLDQDDPDDYYFLSTLYVTAQFFGWVQILRRNVVFLDQTTTRQTKAYAASLEAISTAFSRPNLLTTQAVLADSDPKQSEDKWIYSIWLQAIGDKMIVREHEQERVMGFADFYRQMKAGTDAELRQWLAPVADFYHGLRADQVRFRRIDVIATVIHAFLALHDPAQTHRPALRSPWERLSPADQAATLPLIHTFLPGFRPKRSAPAPQRADGRP